MYYQQPATIPIQPQSNISFVQPQGSFIPINMQHESGLIGGDLGGSITQTQMNLMNSVNPLQQSLTLSKFPMAPMGSITTPVINPNTLTNSNLLVSQTLGVKIMDPQAASQLQAPGQPYIGARPKNETKVLLQTMDHYGSYNLFSFLDVHYPQAQCTIIPKKLYNRFIR